MITSTCSITGGSLTIPCGADTTMPCCICTDCENMKVSFAGLSFTPNASSPYQFNLNGNLNVSSPIFGLEFKIQSFSYTPNPFACSNGIESLDQSCVFLMPNSSINGVPVDLFNETSSGSMSSNMNASKDVIWKSTSPVSGNIPINLITGLPGPMTGLNKDCCKISYQVCVQVTVYYDKDSCKSCVFTYCFNFTN